MKYSMALFTVFLIVGCSNPQVDQPSPELGAISYESEPTLSEISIRVDGMVKVQGMT